MGDTPAPSQSQSNPLARKLNKILESRLDNDKEMLDALEALSQFFGENSLRSRRNLRGDIEHRSLTINEEFAVAFKEVKEQLDGIHEDVRAMSECCQDMTSRLKVAKEQTHDLINQTTKLQAESQLLQMKSEVADAFLSKFQLQPAEMKVLRGGHNTTMTEDFFSALERAKSIHNDVKVLLRTNQQTAGLEIMESMALHLETAYERLYRWTQAECRLLTGDSLEVSPLLCQAMSALQDRPVLFRYSLDEYGTARRTAVVRGFIDALTRGGASGTPRPIEMHSHDPLRYVGDMLAWLHQATASEKEYLQAVLKMVPEDCVEEPMTEVLGHITEGVCRPFKVRVEHVLVAEPGPVILYKLANLLNFYHHTIGSILQASSSLLATTEDMHQLSKKLFMNSLNCHASKLMEKVELPPADLGPTAALNQTMALLREILSSYDSSVVPLDARRTDFTEVLSCVVDPLLQMCAMSASQLNPADMATYMVNCLYMMKTTLSLFEFTDQRLEMLSAQVDAHLDTLVNEQASFTLSHVGLAHMYSVVQQHQPREGPLSAVHGLDRNSIKTAMKQFDAFLASPDDLVLPQCKFLLSATLRDVVDKRSMDVIRQVYEQLYTAVTDPANKYEDPNELVQRTPQQIKQLLS
ncbi:conserved oligomeric Golgi complex subunit 6-like [Branchiostoma floridae x Branchiostoma belcheri]